MECSFGFENGFQYFIKILKSKREHLENLLKILEST